MAENAPASCLCMHPAAPHTVPYLADLSLRCDTASQMSWAREVDSSSQSASAAQALHDGGRVQPISGAFLNPGCALLTYGREAVTSQPWKGNRLINASFPPPWFMRSATAVFRRHSPSLSNNPPTAQGSACDSPHAGFSSVPPTACRPLSIMLRHQTIGLPGSQAFML